MSSISGLSNSELQALAMRLNNDMASFEQEVSSLQRRADNGDSGATVELIRKDEQYIGNHRQYIEVMEEAIRRGIAHPMARQTVQNMKSNTPGLESDLESLKRRYRLIGY